VSEMARPDVTLREITREALGEILKLKVAAGQEPFVANNAVSIAQAHFHPDTAWFRAIYAGETPVGFVMLEDEPAKPPYLWRFMIDGRHQHKGYGRRALELVLDHVRARPGARVLTLSCVPGEGSPGPFYERFGFRYTGEMEDDELVMSLDL
jgi:diamine N-acetyltransferase